MFGGKSWAQLLELRMCYLLQVPVAQVFNLDPAVPNIIRTEGRQGTTISKDSTPTTPP